MSFSTAQIRPTSECILATCRLPIAFVEYPEGITKILVHHLPPTYAANSFSMWGCRAATRKSVAAAPDGAFRPCSHS